MSCLKCEHYFEERSGYEYGDYIEELGCYKNKNFGNLKSFPFKTMQKCFRLNFWLSKYADKINGDPENDSVQFKLYSEDEKPLEAPHGE